MKPTRVTLPADVHQIDHTGHVWTYLDEAEDPQRVVVGNVIVAGDAHDPFLARVIDIQPGSSDRELVHLEAVATPAEVIVELRCAGLLPE